MFSCRYEIERDPARTRPSVYVPGIADALAKAAPGQLPMQALRLGVGTAGYHTVDI
jgi:hypothetical protein